MDLQHLQHQSRSRAERWHSGGLAEWTPLEWAAAMAGEAGEACNAAKKLKRVTSQIAHHDKRTFGATTTLQEQVEAYRADIARECADTILYALCLLSLLEQDVQTVVRDVFNQKSVEYGFPERV